ncbi:hypothetical protein LSCM1_07355 [Leishmania martiniquensis]|nr:hypothetical protein LSCM1_07355 [Leishmania martiniquensis]
MGPTREMRHHAPLACDGCAFHCVHPRLVRRSRAGRRGAAGDARAASGGEDAPISWSVALDDVDAGMVHVPSASDEAVTVTRKDLFTCKVLNRKDEGIVDKLTGRNRQDATNRALLLSSDVWLSHFDGGLPLFFANDTRTSRQGVGDGGDMPLKRLMPLHTSFIHGESSQTVSYYALRALYWLQYDSVYLQNAVRRPDQLRSMPTASGERASPRTDFRTWTMTSDYLRDFQLVVYFNVLRRRLLGGEGENASTLLTAGDAPAVQPWAPVAAGGKEPATRAMATGEVARLGFELLHGTDPMLLPMYGEGTSSPARPAAWRPQTSAEWSGRGTVGGDALSPPPSTPSRIRAIAVVISSCHHNRMEWLSELSRYYPVHNYGRCVIPRPTPLPGDAVPTPGIPQRANLRFPPECLHGSLLKRHRSALASMRTANASLGRDRRVARRAVHSMRDHSVRCVFRKYRYALPFENSIEDDYVTEKVYNALLSGALPLYIGAMNIADYVPGASRRASGGAAGGHGLSVIPVLQMFPVLNETAWRREANRVLALQERDEVMLRQVKRTHAAVLRAQASAMAQAAERDGAAAAKYVRAMAAASTVASALEAAERASRHVSQHHYLLYTDAVHSAETAALKELYGEGAEASGLWTRGVLRSPVPSAVSDFATADGAWPPPWSAQVLLTEAQAAVAGATGGAGHVADRDSAGAVVPASTDASAYLLGYGQCDYLQRVHRDAREAVIGAAAPQCHRAQRRASLRLNRDWSLTPNTALGFMEEAAARRAGNGTDAKSTRRAVQVFPELRGGNATVVRESGWTPCRAQGDMYSRYFNRVDVPPAPAYEREIAATAAPGAGEAPPPMNGFAQLAAYLRALDEDPALIDETGYFDWWRAERMEDLGEAFLGALYREHPVCSICAAALEKKEARARDAAAGRTRSRGAA